MFINPGDGNVKEPEARDDPTHQIRSLPHRKVHSIKMEWSDTNLWLRHSKVQPTFVAFEMVPWFKEGGQNISSFERCSKGLVNFIYSHGAFANPFAVLSRPHSRLSRDEHLTELLSRSFRRIWEVYKIKTTSDTCIYIWYDISLL
jgi:hypothetical protein